MRAMDKTVAVILGGGKGTRLHPLTQARSKPAVPIGGKYRLVDIPISNCLHSEVRQIFVLTQYNSASLNRHIMNTYNFDMFSRGFVDILAAEQTPVSQHWFQGTADAVRQSLHHMENIDSEQVLILSGDQLYQMDYRLMMDAHRDTDADVTIATIPVTAHDATGFGIMKTDDEGMITDFTEKPAYEELDGWASEVPQELKQQGREYLASMGIYIFNHHIMSDLLASNPEARDFGKEIIPYAINEGQRVASYKFDGYWTDIGTVASFFEANLALTDPVPSFDLYDKDKMIYTNARLLPASKVYGTRLERTLLAEGSIVHATHIEHSVVGIRSRIGSGTEIRHAILMGNDYYPPLGYFDRSSPVDSGTGSQAPGIGERCLIENAIIDKNCRIGNDVEIRGGKQGEDGDYGDYAVVDGLVVLPKDSVIPDGITI